LERAEPAGLEVIAGTDRELRCAITTDNAYEPVVIEGTAELVQDMTAITAFVIAINDRLKPFVCSEICALY
jgi:hypothetical protein